MGVTLPFVEFPGLIFENEDFWVIDKPQGWYSIPAREPSPEHRVLSEWIRNQLKQEPWIIHRLDRFTSGIILFAKNKKAHSEANLWFQNRQIRKTYQFLAAPPPRTPALQVREAVDGKPSQTLFEVIQKNEFAFFGKATPLTGRFHQIRFHASHSGFPLLGDAKYGGISEIQLPDRKLQIFRLCLHAYELELPFGKFQVPLAGDLLELKTKLFS